MHKIYKLLSFLFFIKWESFFPIEMKKILEKKERQIINIIKGKEYLSSNSAKKNIDKKVTIEKFKKRSKPSIKEIKLNLFNWKLFWFLLSIFN